MPELPDVTLYVTHLARRLTGRPLEGVRVRGMNVLRSVDPPLESLAGRTVRGVSRVGKRIVIELDGGAALVIHLMIAGRLHWRARGAPLRGRAALAAFDFPNGTLVLTEAATRQRASLHAVADGAALAALDPGGLEPLETDLAGFRARLAGADHTLKRALTDPRIVSGIGNAYSDEILHRARLSPFRRTRQLEEGEWQRLYEATQHVLREWSARLAAEAGEEFPERVTAFRPGMAVHGRYRQPCPDCGAPVQRIVWAENEANYCARCQTAGNLLADRSLSRLLKDDWPRTLEEAEFLGVREPPVRGRRRR